MRHTIIYDFMSKVICKKLIINEFWMYANFFQLKSQVNNLYYIIYLKLFSYDYIRGPIL
jgi:hypothetical protein